MVDYGCVECGAPGILDSAGLCRECRGDDDDEQGCVGCGCTDDNPCPGGCTWVAPNLCSSCA